MYILIITALWSSAIALLAATEARSQDGIYAGLFLSDEPLEMRIETDLRQLMRNRTQEIYQEATLVIREGEDSVKTEIRIRPRGNYRRENCGFPPLLLNFKKSKAPKGESLPFDRLKLVNPCQTYGQFEQYLLREYLIYKAFNLMSDLSFRARLVRISYDDKAGQTKSLTTYSFLIEDESQLASRLNGFLVKKLGLNDRYANQEYLRMMSIFQFMIGNTDWQLAGMQNLILLKVNDPNHPDPFPIPYDFDYTGMVDAPYAIPAPVLELSSIRERKYKGRCYSMEELEETFAYFMEKKDEIYSAFLDNELLNKVSQTWCRSYLDSFYAIAGNERTWKRNFMENCRQ